MNGTGNGVFYMGNGAILNNNTLANFNIVSNDSIQYNTGTSPQFNNKPNATLTKSVGTGVSTLGSGFLLLSNNGTINVQSGTLSLDSQSTDGGSFNASVGARLRFNGNTHVLAAGSSARTLKTPSAVSTL